MKFSEKWLREWVDPPVSTDELVAQLTTSGLEVEGVEAVGGELPGVVVAAIESVEPHPQADRLRVCRVRTGSGAPVSVVCGAPNVHAGMRAPLAPPGAHLPGGVRVERASIRGVASEGMLCSPHELGLGDYAGGLMALPADAPVGSALSAYLDLDDVSIEVAVTPNRGDCLGLAGNAREVGVLNRLAVSAPRTDPVPPRVSDEFPITLDAPADCPIYVGRVIRNIDPTADTPLWMQERLRRSGLRCISPVVDVTNYVLLELGQPMHAFDLGTLEDRIRVRRAREGERLILLDGQPVDLDPDTLVIADEARTVGLAGIMGGLDTSVTERTRHIFLESAFFAPTAIAGRGRRLGLATDAGYRFERGVEPGLQRRAAERATALLLDIVGGEPGPVVEARAEEHVPARPPVELRVQRLQRLLGMEVPPATVTDVLERLGMTASAGEGAWQVTPPAFRFDIAIEADLIEEVARIVGYDTVPEHRPRAELAIPPRPEATVTLARMREVLVQRGYHEAVTYSFVDPQLQSLMDPEAEGLRLANPIAADMAVMRTTLWPGLLQAVLHNTSRQQERVRLFESGLAYRHRDGVLHEEPVIGGMVTGLAYPEQWGVPGRPVDFFDLKSDVEAVLALTGRSGAFRFETTAHPALHPGEAAAIEEGGRRVGLAGALHPRIVRDFKLPGPVYVFELSLTAVGRAELPQFEPISRYPAVRRDLSIVVAEAVPAQAVRDCVGQAATDVLQNLELFDLYRGEGIDSGKKSVTLGLIFQAASRTLTDAEIDALQGRIVDALRRDLDAVLRG
jgi:phenylalanyl-tRNA synthetase beta chain